MAFEENLHSALVAAAAVGDLDGIRRAVQAGAHINAYHEYERNALGVAAYCGQNTAIELLLDLGASIAYGNQNPLRCAVMGGKLNSLKFLLQRGADIPALKNTAFAQAAHYGAVELLSLLYAYGADVHHENDKPLRNAAESGKINNLLWLLDHGANTGADRNAALRSAVGHGRVETAAVLLMRGADIDAIEYSKINWDVDNKKEIISLLSAVELLKRTISARAAESPQMPLSVIRQYYYQAAAVGARCEMDVAQIVAFADSAWQSAAYYENGQVGPFAESRLALVETLALRPFLEAYTLKYIAVEYAEAVLLPQLLLEATAGGKIGLADISAEQTSLLLEKLRPLAATVLWQ